MKISATDTETNACGQLSYKINAGTDDRKKYLIICPVDYVFTDGTKPDASLLDIKNKESYVSTD